MAFTGFPVETIHFLLDLQQNNSRTWFNENRSRYENHLKEPAMQFIGTMGTTLSKIRPDIHIIPKVDGGLFRLNRDTRFGRDKTPYKTNIGILLWEGNRKRMENTGFYFHLEPEKLLLGSGLYMMPPTLMKPFRDAIASESQDSELLNIIEKLEASGYVVGTEHYKRVPTGYDPECPANRFLRFNGLSAIIEMPVPPEVHTPDIIPLCMKHYLAMIPLHKWLLRALP